MDDPKAAAEDHPVSGTVAGEEERRQMLATIASLVSLCSRADTLLQDPAVAGIGQKEITDELAAYIQWCKEPLSTMVRYVLENPHEVLPREICPKLFAVIQGMQMNPYKVKRLRILEWKSKDHAAAKIKAVQHRRKLELQIVAVISQLAMIRDQRANPPHIVMRTIDRVYQGTSQSDWEMQTKERLLVDRTGLRRALAGISDWRPAPKFPSPDDEISMEYTVVIHDNKEWRLAIKWERADKNGNLIRNPIYHTVTSDLGLQ